jgi:hypothetical protein
MKCVFRRKHIYLSRCGLDQTISFKLQAPTFICTICSVDVSVLVAIVFVLNSVCVRRIILLLNRNWFLHLGISKFPYMYLFFGLFQLASNNYLCSKQNFGISLIILFCHERSHVLYLLVPTFAFSHHVSQIISNIFQHLKVQHMNLRAITCCAVWSLSI